MLHAVHAGLQGVRHDWAPEQQQQLGVYCLEVYNSFGKKVIKKSDFPFGPAVKTPHSQSRVPGQGTQIPHATLSSWGWGKLLNEIGNFFGGYCQPLCCICFYHPDFLLYPSVSKPCFICPSQGQCWTYSVDLSYS